MGPIGWANSAAEALSPRRIFHVETAKHVKPQSEGRRRMALYMRDLHRNEWRKWNLGKPLPEDISEIGIFQADGDELRLILDAMQASVTNNPYGQKIADHSTNAHHCRDGGRV